MRCNRDKRGWWCRRAAVFSELAQEIHNFRLLPIDRANKLASQHATAVDNVRLRKLERAIKIIALSLWIAHHEEINIVVSQKLVVCVLVHIDADRQHVHAFILHFLLHLNQRGHLLHARRAPGCPEIQHHNFAPQIAQAHLAIGILHREVWRWVAYARRPRGAIATGQQNG